MPQASYHSVHAPFTLLLTMILLASALPLLLPQTATPALADSHAVEVQSAGIDAFDITGNKIHYWGASFCGGPVPFYAPLQRRILGLSSTAQTVQAASCDAIPVDRPYVVRDDYFFYYFAGLGGTRLARKAAVTAETDPATFLPNVDPVNSRAGLDLREGYLYWSSYNAATNSSIIYRIKADASELPLPLTLATGEVTWLKSLRLRDNSSSEDALIWRTDAGLFRWRSATNPPFGSIQTLASGNIYDVALAFQGNTLLGNARSYALAARSNELLRINLLDGQTTIVYDGPLGRSIQAVTVDELPPESLAGARQIYLTERQTECVVGEGCVTTDRIKRRPLDSTTWNVNEWITIVDTFNGLGGINLRSNGKNLYYLHDQLDPPRIRYVPVDVEPSLMNIAALGLEAVQAIQNLENDVPLLEGKPVLVRGYAYVTVNTTSVIDVRPSARLRGWRDGNYLGEIAPFNDPVIDFTSDLAVLRADPERSFLFLLPSHWVNAGNLALAELRLELEVNPDGAVEETLLQAGGDNIFPATPGDAGATLNVIRTITPCLVLFPVSAMGGPTPSFAPESMPSILARAKTMLPVTNLKVFHVPAVLSDGGDPYDLDDDDSGILDDLWWMWLINDHPAGCSQTFYGGMVHPDANWEWGGLARRDENVLLFKISPGGNTPFNVPGGGRILAHELGHNYGRKHVKCADSDDEWKDQTAFDVLYPYPICLLSYSDQSSRATHFGFDFISLLLAKPGDDPEVAAIAPNEASDLMSYKAPYWVSAHFWNRVLAQVPPDLPFNNVVMAQPARVNGPRLLVQGSVSARSSGRIRQMRVFPEAAAPPERPARAGDPAPITAALRLRDGGGALLAEHPLTLRENDDHDRVGERFFISNIPFVAGTARVELLVDGVVTDQRRISAHQPMVTLAPPQLDAALGVFDLNWSAADGDDDQLRTTVQYSVDGVVWQTLLLDAVETNVTLSTIGLPGGPDALVRVLTSDGAHVAVSPAMPLTSNNTGPVVQMSGLVSGQSFPVSKILNVTGNIFDLEDGTLENQWTLTGPTQHSATGANFSVAGLEPGAYTLELSATDSGGRTSSKAANFTILQPVIPVDSAPVLDGSCGDAVYADALMIRPYQDGWFDGKLRARFVHSGDALYACFQGLPQSDSTTVRQIGVFIDANASGEADTQPGDIGLIARDDGEIAQFVDNGAGMALHSNPQPGYSARIVHDDSYWRAELRIADSLLGGNPSRIRMTVAFVAEDTGPPIRLWPSAADPSSPATWPVVYIGSAPAVVNQPPLAEAGLPRSYWPATPQSIYLDASGSIDPEGDTLSYTWRQIGGPAVTLRNANQQVASFTAAPVAAPTRIRFELTATDGRRASPPRTVDILLLPALGTFGGPRLTSISLPLILR